jgi:hypothetical protein
VDPNPAPEVPEPAVVRSAPEGRRPLHWLLEGIFIVVSVILGFAITEFGEHRDNRALARRMLTAIRAEVEHNRATVTPFVAIHRQWAEALARHVTAPDASHSAIDILFATRPQLPANVRTNIPLLRRAAWDAALSTGALRLIDYELAAGLAEAYEMQAYAGENFAKLFSDVSLFDPAARAGALRLVQITIGETAWAEETLLALYDKQVVALRAAANDD